MRPVEQEHFVDHDTGARGDCVAACVASIFEVPLREVRAQGIRRGAGSQELFRWTAEYHPALDCHIQSYTWQMQVEEDRVVEAAPPIPPSAPTIGYWMAFHFSPRGLVKHGQFRGMPGEHAVVMLGGELVWDPHPLRDMGLGPRTGAVHWIARDPAAL